VNIQELISQAGRHLRAEFENIKNSNPHFAERGAEAEIILSKFLNQHLPKRFAAGSGLIVDQRNNVSSQTDVIIYDAENSPIYRKGERVLILPNDNVSAVIEVKSKLTKRELEDAAQKIVSVKALEKSPITDVDQPVTFSPLITTRTLGVVFAYESATSLQSLAENLRDINRDIPSEQWIDSVVVLDQGTIGYAIQFPMSQEVPGWFGGPASDKFGIFPFYVLLVKEDSGELTLNRFFVNLMAHLTFYRKRSTIAFETVLGKIPSQIMILEGYQYDLKGVLNPVEEAHQQGNLLKALVKFNLYSSTDGVYVGQIAWMPWQDGAIVSYSGRFGPPQTVLEPYFKAAKIRGTVIPGILGANLWLSSVMPLTKEKFIQVSREIRGKVVAKYYRGEEEDSGFPATLQQYRDLQKRKTKSQD
jgi:hypothetical protein